MYPSQSRRTSTALAIACSSLGTAISHADVRFDITALGLTDPENRRADSYISSGWTDYNDKGGVTGRTWRWSGFTYTGISAWFYENKVTTRIGLWDAAHVRSDGFALSQPYSITRDNQVLGGSARYAGTYESQNVWIYSKGVTTTIGMTDSLHTSTSGMQNTPAARQNAAGQVVGYSTQYNGNSGAGETAWIYTNGQTTPIGLRSGQYLNRSGFSDNEIEFLSETGYVAGWADRWASDNTFLGRDTWIYDGARTAAIGLFDTERTSSIGQREARPMGVNSNGDVIGHATRYLGSTLPRGETAWIYRGGTVTKMGLTTGIHVAADGGFVSEPTKINNAGQAAGWSTQYVGSPQGCSTWFFDGSTTRQIGLTGGIHTLSNGTGYSTVVALNDAGVVAGVSQQKLSGLSAHRR